MEHKFVYVGGINKAMLTIITKIIMLLFYANSNPVQHIPIIIFSLPKIFSRPYIKATHYEDIEDISKYLRNISTEGHRYRSVSY